MRPFDFELHALLFTVIPRDVLERLGTQPDEERLFVLADGREVRYPMAWARVATGERVQPTLVRLMRQAPRVRVRRR